MCRGVVLSVFLGGNRRGNAKNLFAFSTANPSPLVLIVNVIIVDASPLCPLQREQPTLMHTCSPSSGPHVVPLSNGNDIFSFGAKNQISQISGDRE
jgi:hypothetical protein